MLKTSFLILSLFVLGSCANNAPIKYVYILDLAHSHCRKYKITDPSNFTVVLDSELDIKQCDGFIGIAPEDYVPLKKYIIDQEANCKGN